MDLSDSPQFKLFHGTQDELKQKAIIKPKKGSLNMPDHKVAFATPYIGEATIYARNRAQHAGLLFSPVYEVEHRDKDEAKKYFDTHQNIDPNPLIYGYHHAISFNGYRTTRIAKWEINPDVLDGNKPRPKHVPKTYDEEDGVTVDGPYAESEPPK